jgi:hypothetical protein
MSLRELLDASHSDADSGDPPSSRSRFLLASIAGAERELWVLTAAAMAVDVLLTLYGLRLGLTELNPVARSAVNTAGAAGLTGLKLAAVAVGSGCLPLLPAQFRAVVPLALALPSLCAVVINALVIGSLLV